MPTFEERFDRELHKLRANRETSRRMGCRETLIEALEHAIETRGFAPLVALHLNSSYGVATLGELEDGDLMRALKFVTGLFDREVASEGFPVRPGTEADGELFWMRGKFRWGAAGPGEEPRRPIAIRGR